jgi:Tol biopolymer transport system component
VRSGTLAWSPNGNRAAFIHEDDYEAYVINADGSGLTNVTPPFEVPDNETLRTQWGRAYVRPAWSPDGQFLAYELYGWNRPIRIVNIEHPEWPHRTIATGMDAEWSPNP